MITTTWGYCLGRLHEKIRAFLRLDEEPPVDDEEPPVDDEEFDRGAK
jgi:hypothetical protein